MDLMQPYGVGRGSAGTPVTNLSVTYSKSYFLLTETAIEQMLLKDIQEGVVPPYDGSQLLVVYTPPGAEISLPDGQNSMDTPGKHIGGYHGFVRVPYAETSSAVFFHLYPFAVIAYPGDGNIQFAGMSTCQQLTYVTSHEIAEAATDPINPSDTLTAWWDDSNREEIADLAEGSTAWLHSYLVTPLAMPDGSLAGTHNLITPPGGPRGGVALPAGATSILVTPTASPGPVKVGRDDTQDLATFSNPDFTPDYAPRWTPDNYSVAIDWGDRQSSSGTIEPLGPGQFAVRGGHAYGEPGTYTVTITVRNTADGATASATLVVQAKQPPVAARIRITSRRAAA